MVDVQEPWGADHRHRTEHFWCDSFDRQRGCRTLGLADCSRVGADVNAASDHHSDGALWLGGFGAAGVAVAGAARLSLDLREVGNDCRSGCRRVRGASEYSVSELYSVRSWRRADYLETALPFSVRDHCV